MLIRTVIWWSFANAMPLSNIIVRWELYEKSTGFLDLGANMS
jgi:hypothetical protein